MPKINTASGKLLSFPVPKHNPGSPVENWIHRILETKDNLVSALELLRVSYNAMLAGRPIREAEKIMEQVEAILKQAEKVNGTAVRAATEVHGSLQPAKQKSLLLFPPLRAIKR